MSLLLAFPSLYEGFGLPMIKGMRYGVLVVTGNRGALAILVVHFRRDVLFPTGDFAPGRRPPCALFAALGDVDLENPYRLCALGRHAALCHLLGPLQYGRD